MSATVERRLEIARDTLLGLATVLDTIEHAVKQAHLVLNQADRKLREAESTPEPHG